MRRLVRVIPLLAAITATAFGASPSAAQSPQSYPRARRDRRDIVLLHFA
jgi:hypothetical protein